MFRHQARMALSDFVQRQCGGSDSPFCKFATEDISWLIFPIFVLILVIFVLYFINNKRKMVVLQQKAKEKNIILDKRAWSVYQAIKEVGTIDPHKIVALGNRKENAPMWIAGMEESSVRNIIKSLIIVGYLSDDGAPKV